MRRRIRETEPVVYWKSMVDAITTLMMVVLLILMFFVLCFLNDQHNLYDEEGNTYNHDAYEDYDGHYYATPTPTLTPTPAPEPDYDDHDGGGGGGDFDPTPTPTPAITPYDGEFDGYDKAAVYAVLVDDETGLVIEVPDVVFELYNAAGTRQTLDTHYPELITYTDYETTEEGGFYLPEKINAGIYFLRQMTEVEGYDFTGDTYFEITESYDWGDPFIVQIHLGAAKNNIQVQINDGVSELGMPGVIFDVVSDGDNVTPDGTIRYSNGEIVDTIECDETGYGLSHELYIGDFRLVPRNLPYGYAAPELNSREINLPRRSMGGEYAPLVVLASYKTSVNIIITDELSSGILVEGVSYTLTADDEETRVYTANSAGHITIEDLSKNKTYRLMQTGTAPGYILSEDVYDFTVDSLGYINLSPSYTIETSSRMLRVEINTIDRITRTPVSNLSITLTDGSGNVIESWVADGSAHEISGLDDGIYQVNVENSDSISIKVEDTSDIQKFNNTVMTTRSYIVIAGIAVLLITIILVGIFNLIAWRKKNRKKRGGIQ
ncbi:MAG: hypothetical protein MJ094_07095 [Saccharofermentans sp.]|nr:hypothetical protein [Saccharofermentans sp.]